MEASTHWRRQSDKPALSRASHNQHRRNQSNDTYLSLPNSLAPTAITPRPFEDLQNEQAYLLQSLHFQGERATRLLQSLAGVEETLKQLQYQREQQQQQEEQQAGAGTGTGTGTGTGSKADARHLRKEAGLLRCRVAEAARQERLILQRLGDVYVEARSRERWWLAVRSRQEQQQGQQRQHGQYEQVMQQDQPERQEGRRPRVPYRPFSFPLSPVHATVSLYPYPCPSPYASPYPTPCPYPYLYQYQSCASPTTSTTATLDPLSPTFVPSVQFNEGIFWGSSSGSPLGTEDDGVAPKEDGRGGETGPGDEIWRYEFAVPGEEASCYRATRRPLRSTSLAGPCEARPGDKRMSLPSLRTVWPREE